MHKCWNVKIQVVYDNNYYTRYAVLLKFQWALYCKIVKSDTHVNEVSLGVSMVSANTKKPR